MNKLTLDDLARAIADGQGDDFDHAFGSKSEWITARGEKGGRYRDINEPRRDDYLDVARAILTTIKEAGYAIVPVEASEEMTEACMVHWGSSAKTSPATAEKRAEQYRVFVAASPQIEGE